MRGAGGTGGHVRGQACRGGTLTSGGLQGRQEKGQWAGMQGRRSQVGPGHGSGAGMSGACLWGGMCRGGGEGEGVRNIWGLELVGEQARRGGRECVGRNVESGGRGGADWGSKVVHLIAQAAVALTRLKSLLLGPNQPNLLPASRCHKHKN